MARHTITYKATCGECEGTGLYQGMCERDGFAVVCRTCGGKGWRDNAITYDDPPVTRPMRAYVVRVLQVNPGVVCGMGKGGEFTDSTFGGMPYWEWLEGRPFPPQSEMRQFVCPCWWYQSADSRLKPEWDECLQTLGGAFSKCPVFRNKAKCWERFDEEND